MASYRVITPDELEYVFKLANERPDLRTIGADLAELDGLRQRVVRGEAAFAGLAKSQTDLKAAIAQYLKAKG